MRAILIAATLLLVTQVNPSALPLRDHHEGFLVAADPYTDASRAKERFGKADPVKAGILPIEVYLRNETTQPMRVNLSAIRLEIQLPGSSRQRLEPLDIEEVADEIAHLGSTPGPTARHRLPPLSPLPRRDKKQKQLADKLRPLTFQTDIVPPSSTIHGFLFFDLSGDFTLLSRASLYMPEVKAIGSNHALTYFEIDFPPSATQ